MAIDECLAKELVLIPGINLNMPMLPVSLLLEGVDLYSHLKWDIKPKLRGQMVLFLPCILTLLHLYPPLPRPPVPICSSRLLLSNGRI